LTIENRGITQKELRPLIGDWIFGCDVCQQVCPWNKPNLVPKITQTMIDLKSSLQLTPHEFRIMFGDTPIMRSKYQGFMRNLIIAAGNSKNRDLIPCLQSLLDQKETLPLIEIIHYALERISS
jgi:epoxyqueuosine reductase